jgi:hypothetical protein
MMRWISLATVLGSLSAALIDPTTGWAQQRTLTAAVLVNQAQTAGFAEYQRYPERYLEHLQVPYETIDVATVGPPANLGDRQLIVAGHRGLGLSVDWRTAIVNAVRAGTGFVNLDADPAIGSQSHMQALFGATSSFVASAGNVISVPAAVVSDGSSPHYIAGLQTRFLGMPAGQDLSYPFHNPNLSVSPTVLTGAVGTIVARIGTNPLILARDLPAPEGRVVHFGSYDYLKADRFGFLMGIDDLFWRSLVWAARKPFVFRGYPRLFAVQLDDTIENWVVRARDLYDPALTGPMAADGTGGPWAVTAYVFTDRLAPGTQLRSQMITDVASGALQVSPHAFGGDGGPDMYYKVPQTPPPTDADWQAHLNGILAWIQGNGGSDRVPSISKAVLPHYWVMGDNTGFDLWNSLGFRYFTSRQKPGVPLLQSCCPDPAGRIPARPFRLYEMPPNSSVDDDFPLFYADQVSINSRAGLPAQTFTLFTTSVNQRNQPGGVHRVDFAWPGSAGNDPTWDVAKSLNQLKRWTWRLWSSQAPVNLYTHDSNNLVRSSVTDRRTVIQQGSQWLDQHEAFHVFMEDLGAYVHARTRSRLTQAGWDGSDITLTYTGDARNADGQPVTTSVYIFMDDDEGALRSVPGFADGTSVGVPVTGPQLAVAPASMSFSAAAGSNPAPQTLQITNDGFGALDWTSSDDAPWLSVAPANGSAPSQVTVSVDTAGLAAGTYTAAITVSAPGAGGSPATVPVTLTLSAAAAPAITRVSPRAGSTAGGESLQVLGTGFATGTEVRVGGTLASVVSAQGSTSIVVTTPPGVEGAANVTVTNAGGSATATGAFTYVAPGSILLIDGFTDGNFNGWNPSPLGRGQFWTATSGTLVYGGGGHTQLVTGQSAWTDYTVEARFRLASLSNFPGGLRGRVNLSTGAGYEIWLYPATSEMALFRVTGWSIDTAGLTQLGRVTVPFDTANFHSLRLTFSGSTISAAYDGQVRITVTDATYASGGVALDVSNQPIEWDDVQVLTSAPPASSSIDLTVTAVSNPPASVASGETFSVTDTTRNEGTGGAPATTTRYYFSTDAARNAGDILLGGSRAVGALGAGSTSAGTVTVTVPTTASGVYRLLACADDTGAAAESSETNNCLASTGVVQVVGPDLVVTALSNPPATASPAGTFAVTDTTANQGGRATSATTTTRYYLSTDQARNTGDTALTGTRAVGALAAGSSSSGTVTVTVPSGMSAGTYFLLACADDDTTEAEQSETNNCRASTTSVQVTIGVSDLVVTAVSDPPATAFRRSRFTVTDTTQNSGTGSAGSSTTRYYLSTDQTRSTGDRRLSGSRVVPGLAAGGQSTGSVLVQVPNGTNAGLYWLLACSDDTQTVTEGNETNNCRASATRVTVP